MEVVFEQQGASGLAEHSNYGVLDLDYNALVGAFLSCSMFEFNQGYCCSHSFGRVG